MWMVEDLVSSCASSNQKAGERSLISYQFPTVKITKKEISIQLPTFKLHPKISYPFLIEQINLKNITAIKEFTNQSEKYGSQRPFPSNQKMIKSLVNTYYKPRKKKKKSHTQHYRTTPLRIISKRSPGLNNKRHDDDTLFCLLLIWQLQ